MPIYEYQCNACGHEMEAFQKMSEAALTECPKCHQASLQKLVSSAGFQLKGTGWYETDFKNKGKSTPKSDTKTDVSGQSTSTEATQSKEDKSSTSEGKTE